MGYIRKSLLGLSLGELKEITFSLAMPSFTAKQIAEWLYKKHITSIDEMSNISKINREKLKSQYQIGAMPPIEYQESKDGTKKYLFPTDDGKFIETVYIPDNERATLCVSSQVGCKMGCLFCMTAKQGFQGNLSSKDIINQIFSLPERESLTNIVFMGQGEPLDNIDEVLKSIEILTSEYGFAWSPRRITISTVGIKKSFEKLLFGNDCHIAISLHSPISSQRSLLMPSEKAFSIEEIVEILKTQDFSHQRRLSFEYIVFKGLNDSIFYAKKLKKLLLGLSCRVNLIRFHEIPNVDFKEADLETMEAFRNYLTLHGIFSTIRTSRGQDISAACGLLSTAKNKILIKQ